MYIYLVIGLLFGAGAVSNLFESPIPWPDVSVSGGLAFAMFAMYFWIRWNYRRRQETLQWLHEHKDEITDDEKYFKDSPFPMVPISRDRQMRDFKVVTSAILVTTTHHVGGDLRTSAARGVIATLWTLVFGWWGFPWGPIKTIQALFTNLSGGEKESVRLASLTAEAALKLETGKTVQSKPQR